MIDGEGPDPVVPDSWSMTAVVVVFYNLHVNYGTKIYKIILLS